MEYIVAAFNIKCPHDLLQVARDLLADAAAGAGFESFEDTDRGLNGYAQKTLFDKTALDMAIEAFPLPDATISYTISDAENKDWNEEWEKNGFEPIEIDGKLIIEDANRKPTDKTTVSGKPQVILIDARLAFGTGTHETTRMIVSTLLSMDLRGKTVLDCGCGTGILGIAASKLGAKNVVSYDIDEWSVENTKHNALINDVHNIRACLGDASVISTFKEKFDLVLANINRNILLHDMPAMASVMAGNASLILSGFYKEDIPLLDEKARSLGLSLEENKSNGEWQMLRFSK